MKATTISLCLVASSAGLGAGVASASPTMIRLGRGRELETSEAPPRRLMFDVRFVAASQVTPLLSQSSTARASRFGLPDSQTFIGNGTDSRDTKYPTQVKAFLWSGRFQITPYLFGPGGDEPRAVRQYGGGGVGGVDVWQHHAILGLSTRVTSGTNASRRSVGAYARLGFGKWGILAEHDLTARETFTDAGDRAETRHLAGHTPVFFAPKEWLVTSLAGEHLVVDGIAPRAHTYRLTPAVQARAPPTT